MRVRGHSRFLRRRGDFVDLHYNPSSSSSSSFKVCFNEEGGRERREGEKKDQVFRVYGVGPLAKESFLEER